MSRTGSVLGPLRRIDAADLPAGLRELSRPLAELWCLGDPSALDEAPLRHVAIVGTREASPYGIRIAERLATACARAGLVVVSGLARGVDAAAHRAALAAGGRTVGVQGTGVDVPYPASHRALHAALCDRGTVVSELEPGTLASPGCFPRRNRIIAAMCAVTVVVEAGYKSGAINTATQALDLGRTVAAVPGRIDEERAAGSNQLLRDGAQVIGGEEDLLGLFGLSTVGGRSGGFGILRAGVYMGLPGDESSSSDNGVNALSQGRSTGGSGVPGTPADSTDMPFRLSALSLLEQDLRG